jgi:hypothetical protein
VLPDLSSSSEFASDFGGAATPIVQHVLMYRHGCNHHRANAALCTLERHART